MLTWISCSLVCNVKHELLERQQHLEGKHQSWVYKQMNTLKKLLIKHF